MREFFRSPKRVMVAMFWSMIIPSLIGGSWVVTLTFLHGFWKEGIAGLAILGALLISGILFSGIANTKTYDDKSFK